MKIRSFALMLPLLFSCAAAPTDPLAPTSITEIEGELHPDRFRLFFDVETDNFTEITIWANEQLLVKKSSTTGPLSWFGIFDEDTPKLIGGDSVSVSYRGVRAGLPIKIKAHARDQYGSLYVLKDEDEIREIRTGPPGDVMRISLQTEDFVPAKAGATAVSPNSVTEHKFSIGNSHL